jgi:hypothetical protein
MRLAGLLIWSAFVVLDLACSIYERRVRKRPLSRRAGHSLFFVSIVGGFAGITVYVYGG